MSVRSSRGVQAATGETGTVAVVWVQGVTDGLHDGVWVQRHGKALQQARGIQLRRAMGAIIHIDIISKS